MRGALAAAVLLLALAFSATAQAQDYDRRYSRAASEIAETSVDVYCWHSFSEWNTSAGPHIAGWYSDDEIHLSPTTCAYLDRLVYDRWRPYRFRKKLRAADALETFTHETEHAYGIRNEKRAECYAMQDMELAARRLGLRWRYGRALAKLYWNHLYPDTRYWSPKCRESGPWDIYDDTSIWP
jgi:hypothetical protein